MKVSYHDQRNGHNAIEAKSFKITRTTLGINLEMEFLEKDATGSLKITLNQPDIREFPKFS